MCYDHRIFFFISKALTWVTSYIQKNCNWAINANPVRSRPLDRDIEISVTILVIGRGYHPWALAGDVA